ncbi:MAG: hypothetical protein ACO25F_04995 [Erythrobacter sp.]
MPAIALPMLFALALWQSATFTPFVVVPPPAQQDVGAVTAIDAAMLEQFCGVDGGVAGRFGMAPYRSSAKETDTAGNPYWWFEAPAGPFNRYSVFMDNNTDRVQALRYIGPTTASFDMHVLIAHLEQVAPSAGWKRRVAPPGVISNLWEKTISTGNGDVTLRLIADGGMESTSLYCKRTPVVAPSTQEGKAD